MTGIALASARANRWHCDRRALINAANSFSPHLITDRDGK